MGMEYLDERYPSNPILPRSFEERADVRAIAHLIASGIQPLQNLGVQQKVGGQFGDEAKKKWAKDVIEEGFAGLEAVLQRTAGKCCFGDTFTMADACLVPQAYAADRFGANLAQFPTVHKVVEHLRSLEVVKA